VLQHDMLLLDYHVTVEKGTQTFEERNCGVFWVTISLDVHPPSPSLSGQCGVRMMRLKCMHMLMV